MPLVILDLAINDNLLILISFFIRIFRVFYYTKQITSYRYSDLIRDECRKYIRLDTILKVLNRLDRLEDIAIDSLTQSGCYFAKAISCYYNSFEYIIRYNTRGKTGVEMLCDRSEILK